MRLLSFNNMIAKMRSTIKRVRKDGEAGMNLCEAGPGDLRHSYVAFREIDSLGSADRQAGPEKLHNRFQTADKASKQVLPLRLFCARNRGVSAWISAAEDPA